MTVPDSSVAIITGASSGIGLAAARMLAGRGWGVVLVARDEARLREAAGAAASVGDASRVASIAADVADASQPARMVRGALERFGRIDALINSAGAAPLMPIEKHTPEVVRAAFAVNAEAPANLIAAAWPTFAAQRRGCIVSVSSMAARDPFAGFFAYGAAKAAVNLLTLSAAREGKAKGIRAFAVGPGAVETPMLRSIFSKKAVPPSACLKPEDVASVIVDCVEGRRDAENGTVIYLPSPGR